MTFLEKAMNCASIILTALLTTTLAQAQPAEEKSRVTLPQVTQVIVPGSLMSRAKPPARYGAVLGWGQAVTLSASQTATAKLEIDTMQLIEQNPTTGLLAPQPGAVLNFDMPIAFRSQGELYNRLCPDGTYNNACWFQGATTTIPSSASGGVVTIDLSTMPTKVPHFWTSRVPARQGSAYWLIVTFRVTGAGAAQFGVDYWLTQSADYTTFDEHCERIDSPANNCEAWVSNWIGDTDGQFVTVLFPVNFPAPIAQAGRFANAFEYRHVGFDHYFSTTIADEVTKLDHNVFSGWERTGESFGVAPTGTGGALDVCRFFSAVFAPKSSHFYTSLASECAFNQTDPERRSVWTYEGTVFSFLPVNSVGNCAGVGTPIYRLYNNGQGGAPNHRYTSSLTTRSQMMGQGWIAEGAGIGIIGCSPPTV
jgi:hypothetical protein